MVTVIGMLGVSPDIAALVTQVLQDEGILTEQFPLHGDIVPVLGKVRLDALLVDGHPYSNVVALVKALRDHPPTAAVPIVVLTGKDLPELRQGHEHVTQVLIPFDLQAFVDAVQSTLKHARSAPDAGTGSPPSR